MAGHERSLMHALGPARDQAIELMSVVAEDEAARVARWEDEKPSLEQLVASLTQSYEIVKASMVGASMVDACMVDGWFGRCMHVQRPKDLWAQLAACTV